MHIDDILHITRGSIYFWENHAFNENEEDNRNKYWITLNCKVNDFPINVVLPTSQNNNWYYSNLNNMIDTVVIEASESEYFFKKTIIDLKNITHESKDNIEEAWDLGYLKYHGSLEVDLFGRIEAAIRNAITISPMDKKEYLCEEDLD